MLNYVTFIAGQSRLSELGLCSLHQGLLTGYPVMESWVARWWPSGIRQTNITWFSLEIYKLQLAIDYAKQQACTIMTHV